MAEFHIDPIQVECTLCGTHIPIGWDHGPHLVQVPGGGVALCMKFDSTDLAAHMFTHEPGVEVVAGH